MIWTRHVRVAHPTVTAGWMEAVSRLKVKEPPRPVHDDPSS